MEETDLYNDDEPNSEYRLAPPCSLPHPIHGLHVGQWVLKTQVHGSGEASRITNEPAQMSGGAF